MGDFELVTAADVRLRQGLAQRVGFRPLSRDVPLIKPAVQANRAIWRILFIASSAATLYASARVG
jgi:hypothetical protein